MIRQLAMLALNKCPKCSGYLYKQWGEIHCLNCGKEIILQKPQAKKRRVKEMYKLW